MHTVVASSRAMNPKSRSRGANMGRRIRERSIAWVCHRPDLRMVIQQCRHEVTIQVRPASPGLIRGKALAALTPIQEDEVRKFVDALSKELDLHVVPKDFTCNLGYVWAAFQLTLPN